MFTFGQKCPTVAALRRRRCSKSRRSRPLEGSFPSSSIFSRRRRTSTLARLRRRRRGNRELISFPIYQTQYLNFGLIDIVHGRNWTWRAAPNRQYSFCTTSCRLGCMDYHPSGALGTLAETWSPMLSLRSILRYLSDDGVSNMFFLSRSSNGFVCASSSPHCVVKMYKVLCPSRTALWLPVKVVFVSTEGFFMSCATCVHNTMVYIICRKY